jgi:hypothetical protein
MRLYRRYAYRLGKSDTAGALFARILRTFDAAPDLQFFFQDHESGGVSAVARITKRFPKRRAFETDGGKAATLSRLDDRFEGHDARTWQRWPDNAEELGHLVERLPLPHALPEHPGPSTSSGLTSTHKPELLAVFRPLGWRYLTEKSGKGAFALSKTTARNNLIVLELDVGTWSHHCVCQAHVLGLGWRASFPVEFARGPFRHQYPVADSAWRPILENIAFVVRHFEASVLPEVEAIHEPSPRWFPPLAL